MATAVVIGAQWGDEGKGKVVDLLAERAEMVVRFQGGNNAGHTLVVGGEKTILHLIPSGILQPGVTNLIAQGVVVDPGILLEELSALEAAGVDITPQRRLVVSRSATVITPYHRAIDKAREARLADGKIGTTGRGIGPAYEDVASRRAIRMGDLLSRTRLKERLDRVLDERNAILTWLGEPPVDRETLIADLLSLGERLAPYLGDAEHDVRNAVERGAPVLFEGAQGVLLDVLHGTYPFVTSSSTISGSVCASVGLPPETVRGVVGIAKAYATRVGAGPFPTEIHDEVGDFLRDKGHEYGSTTGRPRRCGWLDLVALKHAQRLNGFSSIALTKLDVLSGLEELRMCVAYRTETGRLDVWPGDAHSFNTIEPVYETLPGWSEELQGISEKEALPATAKRYLSFIEEKVGVPISLVGVGPGRKETIVTGSLPL